MISFPWIRRWVAGESAIQAIDVGQQLNRRGLGVAFHFLGERVESESRVRCVAEEYALLVKLILEHRVDASLSIKPTQIGLAVSEEACRSHLEKLLGETERHQISVTLETESSRWVDGTLKVFQALRPSFPHLGISLQSALYRTDQDIECLLQDSRPFRLCLCKGVYRQSPAIAYPDPEDVHLHFRRQMIGLLDQVAESKIQLTIATHDAAVLQEAVSRIRMVQIPTDSLELQMLYGVRNGVLLEKAAEGFHGRVYVPYGKQWLRYLGRRLRERGGG